MATLKPQSNGFTATSYGDWYIEKGTGRAETPPSPLLVVPDVTAHPSTAIVPTAVHDIRNHKNAMWMHDFG